MFMAHRNRLLREKLDTYLARCRETMACLGEGLRHYTVHGLDAHFEALATRIHARETDADTVRREIGVDLFAKSLLPDSREDLLLLLERVDLMPNQAEDVLRQLLLQNISMPAFTHARWLELADTGIEAFDLVQAGIGDAIAQGGAIQEITRRIDNLERTGDQLEQRLVHDVFRSELPPPERILVRDIVNATGQICDYAQDIGIFLTIFCVKRHE